ncbi:MAG TPA: DUF2884 family protein [Xanthomonadaceae bacterium]|nr:DUF2884 family protein [Xanthomonadaceae bacterium]
MNSKPLLLATALALAGPAHAGLSACDVDSDYHLRITPQTVVFHRDSGTPARVEIAGGRLIVDAQPQVLSAADRERVLRFEHEVRALVPEVKAIALEAADLAVLAVTRVIEGLAGADSDSATRLLERVDALHRTITDRIAGSLDTAEWDESGFESEIESLVQEVVPMIAADAAALAIAAAMSGDETGARAFEERMERMGRDIEREVQAQADLLEARAEALCPQLVVLERIDASLEYRTGQGEPLDLLRVEGSGNDG